METDQKVIFRKRIEALWGLSRPYRAGFALGFLVVSLTLVLIFTGQKSQKLSFKASPRQSEATLSSALAQEPIATTLGVSTISATVNEKQINQPVKSNQTRKININTASAMILDSLPYLRPATAKAVVDYRILHGPFKNIEELMRVKGIKEGIFSRIKNFVSVE